MRLIYLQVPQAREAIAVATVLQLDKDDDPFCEVSTNIACLAPPFVTLEDFVFRIMALALHGQPNQTHTFTGDDRRTWTIALREVAEPVELDAFPAAPPRSTKPGFTRQLRMEGHDGGSSVLGLSIGTFVDAWGHTHFPVVAKRSEIVDNFALQSVRRMKASRKLRIGNSGPIVNAKATLEDFAKRVGDHRNIMRILGVEILPAAAAGKKRYMDIYSPWYAGGSLTGPVVARYGRAGALHILLGAFTGLQVLNEQLEMLHMDIKPANVFIDIDVHGLPVGVIGDIDDVVRRNRCRPEEHFGTIRTPCYAGAPFKHCDIRRDQCAMLITAVEVLTRQYWWNACNIGVQAKVARDHRIRNQDLEEEVRMVRASFGYLGTTPADTPGGWLAEPFDYFIGTREQRSDVPAALWDRFLLLRDTARSREARPAEKLRLRWGTYPEAHAAIVRDLREAIPPPE